MLHAQEAEALKLQCMLGDKSSAGAADEQAQHEPPTAPKTRNGFFTRGGKTWRINKHVVSSPL